ncbi:MAG: hypothetical protein IJG57_04795 [Firmicutes bacterium]|nr:hypothetical protein [Bacillota bacterium]
MGLIEKSREQRIAELGEIIDTIKRFLMRAPDGNLRVNRTRTRIRFYRLHENRKKKPDYLGVDNASLIRQLAQKDYWQEVLKRAEEEAVFLGRMGERYPGPAPEEVYDTLDEIRRSLVRPIVESDEEYVCRWLAVPYEKKPIRDGSRVFYTENGETVRSKSEVIIANTYKAEGIPYRYEFPMTLQDGRKVHPDFTALNVRERKTMIHEHFGMMDDPDYLNYAMEKIRRYAESGFFPGTNLILTFETSDRPLDTQELRRVIRHYLI